MKKIKWLLVGCTILFLSGCGSSQADTTEEKKATTKIVSTTVAITDIFAKLDLDLVGIPESSKTLPKRYVGVTTVGSPMSPDFETIKTLNPDLVYSTKTLKNNLQEDFKKADIPVDYLDLTSLPSMLEEITALGKKYQRSAEAKKLVASLQSEIDQVAAETAEKEPVKVLVLMGLPGSYVVATEHSFLGNLVTLAGGTNAITGESGEYISANSEALQASQPDVILRAAHGMPEEVVEMFAEEFASNDIWQHFTAVKNQRVYDLDYDLFGMTATLDSTKALKELEQFLYED